MNEAWIMGIVSMVCFFISFTRLFKKRLKFIKFILRFYAYFCAGGIFFISFSESQGFVMTGVGLLLIIVYTLILIYLKQQNITDAVSTFFSGIGILTKSVIGIGVVCILGFVVFTLPIGDYIPLNNTPVEDIIENIYFSNCTDAFSEGFSNINVDDPGYRPDLDRDNDGVACER